VRPGKLSTNGPKPLVAGSASRVPLWMQATTTVRLRARSLPCEMWGRTAAPTAAINSRLREREDEAGRGRMRVPLAVDVGDEGLRDAYATADMNRLALGPHGAHLVVQ
jgi:hypothetical protein